MATKFLDFKTLNPPYSATSRREGPGQEPYGGDLQEVGGYHVQRHYCNGSNTVFTSFDNSGRLYSRSSSFYSQRRELAGLAQGYSAVSREWSHACLAGSTACSEHVLSPEMHGKGPIRQHGH